MAGQKKQIYLDVEFSEQASEGTTLAGKIKIPVDLHTLTPRQRMELSRIKTRHEAMDTVAVDLASYQQADLVFEADLLEMALDCYTEEPEPLQDLLQDYLDRKHLFRRQKEQEHEQKRRKFNAIPVERLVVYSDSIGIGPYVRVPLGAQKGEATLNRKILNDMRPYFTDASAFLGRFQQATLLAERHNEALAERLLALWKADPQHSGEAAVTPPQQDTDHFDDVEVVIEFDDVSQVA